MRRTFILPIFASVFCLLSGCSSAPTKNILGSYFPSWMLCSVLGIVLTIFLYMLFLKVGIDEFIPAKLLVYLGMVISFTLFIWLIWYGN